MGFKENLREPAALAAAVILGAVAAVVMAPGWLALLVGLGTAVAVLVSYAALTPSADPKPKTGQRVWPDPTPTVVPKSTAQAQDLLRRICAAALEVRVRGTSVDDADPVMVPTTKVVDAAYRVAALIARNDGRLGPANATSALSALTIGAKRMDDVSNHIDGPSAKKIATLVDDLGLVKLDLESVESALLSALRDQRP
jgi:hypothetical protein